MGANECGVVIGNEAVWTKVPMATNDKKLLGMDLVRLGLERGSTSKGAMDAITKMLEEHGQGGPCAENDPDFTYHNSFLIADHQEAWVLETAGKQWVAQRVTEGARSISNNLTIRTDSDLHSSGLYEYAKEHGLWNGTESLDFTACFSEDGEIDEPSCSRYSCGKRLLEAYKGTLDQKAMRSILRDHDGGICMHGHFETTASMVSELRLHGNHKAQHWMTGRLFPCRSEFTLQSLHE